MANEYLRKHVTEVSLDDYPFRVYIVPKGDVCSWGGMGYIGCYDDCRTWVNGDLWDVSGAGRGLGRERGGAPTGIAPGIALQVGRCAHSRRRPALCHCRSRPPASTSTKPASGAACSRL